MTRRMELPKPRIRSAMLVAGLLLLALTCVAARDGQMVFSLEPNQRRDLEWKGGSNPRIMAVPKFSFEEQPFFGFLGDQVKPLYVKTPNEARKFCFASLTDSLSSPACLAGVRNFPYESWTPALIAFPTKVKHLRTLLKFANDHRMCISIVGTGHDVLNRHTSCGDSLMIRMSLFKTLVADLEDTAGLGAPNIKLGAGIVMSEAQHFASLKGYYVLGPWSPTIGMVGWTISGGHGPFAPLHGLGAENLLEAEIMKADGEIIIASATTNPDIFYSLRGGGGSTWGIILSITVRAFRNPNDGFSLVELSETFPQCEETGFEELLTQILSMTLALDATWSGKITLNSRRQPKNEDCDKVTDLNVRYAVLGTDVEIARSAPQVTVSSYKTWYDYVASLAIDPIIPIGLLRNGFPSFTVAKDFVAKGKLSSFLVEKVLDCKLRDICKRIELFHDLPRGVTVHNLKSPINTDYKNAFMLVLAPNYQDIDELKPFIDTLGKGTYFGESAYHLPDFVERYWGEVRYQMLLEAKKRIDPTNRFTCHNCVGSRPQDWQRVNHFGELDMYSA